MKTTSKAATSTTSRLTVAHRGYLITHNVLYREFYVSKDGVHICTSKGMDEAKAVIDELTA